MMIKKFIMIGLVTGIAVVFNTQAEIVTNGLYLYIVADDLALTDGAIVTNWTDSVSSNVLTNSDGTNGAPTYITNFANGHAAVHFDGIDDNLNVDVALKGAVPDTKTTTMFVVAQYLSLPTVATGAESFHYMVGTQAHAGGNGRFRIVAKRDTTGDLWSVRVGGGAQVSEGNSDTNLNVFSVVSGQPNANSVTLRVNGTVALTALNTNGTVMDRIDIGANSQPTMTRSFAEINIAEMLIYNRTLSDAEITEVTDTLTARYINSSPPEATIASIIRNGNAFILEFKSENGLQYKLFGDADLSDTNDWVDTGESVIIGDGDNHVFTNSPPSAEYFFQIRTE